jgi:hypothetical protein
LQQSDGNHYVVRVAPAQKNAFHIAERSIIDAHPVAFPQKGPMADD